MYARALEITNHAAMTSIAALARKAATIRDSTENRTGMQALR
jgi:hypothetical protein